MTKDFSIEFENLVEEDVPEEFVRPVTQHESQLVQQGMLYELLAEQAKVDRELEEQLAAQEEALKMEEETYYAERRAAAALARQQRSAASGDPLGAQPPEKNDWSDVELDDEAFDAAAPPDGKDRAERVEEEEFLRRVSTEALPSAAANAHTRLLQQRLNQGFGDFQSVSSGREASIDLDWDHEPGMNPALAEGMARSATEEDLTRLAVTQTVRSDLSVPAASRTGPGRADSPASLVWEHDPAMDFSRRHLLAEDT